jgi:DNA invertase Pin-like site-specific DNA recombinase
MCGLVGAVLVDFDGAYDPNLVNDRLLLGMKGEMAAFELSLLRQRSLEAIRQKARRGELQFYLPVGLCWSESGKMERDPEQFNRILPTTDTSRGLKVNISDVLFDTGK